MTNKFTIASILAASLLTVGCNDETAASDSADTQQPDAMNVAQQSDSVQAENSDTTDQLPERVKHLEGKKPLKDQTPMQTTTVTGTVTYKDLEGGFYALITQNGQRFLLQGLEKQYQKHGIVANVTGKPRPDMRTIQQFGIPFEVSAVEVVDDTNVTTSNNEK